MRIAFFIDNMSMGGAQRVVSVLSSHLAAEGHEVSIVIRQAHFGIAYTPDSAVKIVILEKETADLMPVKLSFHNARKFIAKHSDTFSEINIYYDEAERALTYFRKNPVDIIFSFLMDTNISAALCAKKLGIRTVIAERNFPDCPMPGYLKHLRNFAYRKADVCVFQTEEQILAFPSAVQKKGEVIPNPIKEDLPEPFTGKRNHTIVNHCGYKAQKNTALLINAFAKVSAKYPEYSLDLYGYGELRDQLQEQINALGLAEKVRLRPFEKEIHKLILPCAMFVMSSDYEGMPNALMEAMGIGLPVISTNCKGGGAKALIRNHENGLLVPTGDVDALAKAMEFYIENPDIATEYAQRALAIRETLSVKKIAQKWLMLCK